MRMDSICVLQRSPTLMERSLLYGWYARHTGNTLFREMFPLLSPLLHWPMQCLNFNKPAFVESPRRRRVCCVHRLKVSFNSTLQNHCRDQMFDSNQSLYFLVIKVWLGFFAVFQTPTVLFCVPHKMVASAFGAVGSTLGVGWNQQLISIIASRWLLLLLIFYPRGN